MAQSVSSFQSIPGLPNATVEPVDNPHQKIRVKRQLERLHRLSYSGIVCLLIDTLYFAYRMKCLLDGLVDLRPSDVLIVLTFLGLELNLACESRWMISADERNVNAEVQSQASFGTLEPSHLAKDSQLDPYFA